MKTFLTFFAIIASLAIARAGTTIDPANKYAYGANVGWVNWGGDTNNGAVIGEYVCSGYIYSANVGWISMGSGSPANGIRYRNNAANDYGVNNDGLGILRGFAYGANISWINFENTGVPAVNLRTGQFTGSVWSANCGWISLSNAVAYVQTDTISPGLLDTNGLPIAWELQNFGQTGVDPNADPDGDGMSNMQEYLAGTNPLDANSSLFITTFGALSGGPGFSLGADCTASHCAAINNLSFGFNAGDHGVFSDCTATGNSADGFDVGKAGKLTGCVASLSQGAARGFAADDGTLVKDCTAISNGGDGIYGSHGCLVSGCAVRLNGGNGITADYGTVITDCAAVENTGIGISAGGNGILVKDCDANGNTGDGIRVASGCQILNNLCSANGSFASPNAAGIHVTSSNNRIEGNTLTLNHNLGLQVDYTNGVNLIIRNSALNNYGNSYIIAPGNKDAQILSVGSGFTNSNPWANFQ